MILDEGEEGGPWGEVGGTLPFRTEIWNRVGVGRGRAKGGTGLGQRQPRGTQTRSWPILCLQGCAQDPGSTESW